MVFVLRFVVYRGICMYVCYVLILKPLTRTRPGALRGVTCHIGSHTVLPVTRYKRTCPVLTPASKLVLDLPTPRSGFTPNRTLFRKKCGGPRAPNKIIGLLLSRSVPSITSLPAAFTHKVVISLTIDEIRLLGRSSEAPPHQLGVWESAVSSPSGVRKRILEASRTHKTHLEAIILYYH